MPTSKTPRRTQQSPRAPHQLDSLARELVEARIAPTVACVTCTHRTGSWTCAQGFASAVRADHPSGSGCVFDLASLTKPFFAVAVHTAVERGELDEQAPLGELLPAMEGTWAARRTIGQLLSHRSGLLAHVELFQILRQHRSYNRTGLLRIAANSHASSTDETANVFAPVYSDLGYLLCGAAVEHRTGQALDDWLGMNAPASRLLGVASVRQWFSRGLRPSNFVPTEVVPWRGGLLRGIVHDENAWLLAGHGTSGHAGLFGTALAVAELGMDMLDALAGRPSPIARSVAQKATAIRSDGTLCSGFDRRASFGSSAGDYCSAKTFGHLGFTGTSVWCDPEQDAVTVLLTNRVCPSRENLRIRNARPRVHDALFRWASEGYE